MLPISTAKQNPIRSALNAASIWRFVVLMTLISCWGTIGTIYFFFNSNNPQQQQQAKPGEGLATPEGPSATALPWFSSWLLRRADGAHSPSEASCGEIKTAVESSSTTVDPSQAAESVADDNPTLSALPVVSELSKVNSTESDNSLLVRYGDSIYLKDDWDGAPVVVEKYKLIFFTVPKVGCTAFKQLLRRMEGHKNWDVEEYDKMLPWNPSTNGLRYLYDYSPERASDMMTSQEWTRAIFVREPKARLLSAYLDKAFHKSYVRDKCCSYTGSCVGPARASLDGFLRHVVYFCDNAHWKPQHRRMEDKYWPYINFVGHMETMGDDARQLLERIGAWKEFGASGWGPFHNGTLFGESSSVNNGGQKHATDAAAKLRKYYSDPKIIRDVESYYDEDYRNPYLNITRLVL